MLYNGWEFFILNPLDTITEQKTQERYVKMYNKAYDTFLKQICIPNPEELIEEDYEFTYYIDLRGENDIIELDEKYGYNFLKSVFLNKKFKQIKNDATVYYKKYNITILNFYIYYKALYIILKKSKSQ